MPEELPRDNADPDRTFYVDIEANRRSAKWTTAELVGRTLWVIVGPIFSLSPRPFWGWRNTLLRVFGARIGRRVHVHPTVRIAIPWTLAIDDEAAIGDGVILYSLGPIHIGRAATISQYAHLCAGTHDYRRAELPLLKLPISVGESAWICADAFIGPDVTIGPFAIVGARAVVIRNVEAWTIVAGNPARVIRMRSFIPTHE